MSNSPFDGARITDSTTGDSAGVQKGDISVITVCGAKAYITVIGNDGANTVFRDGWDYIEGDATDIQITGSLIHGGANYSYVINKGADDIVCTLSKKGSKAEDDDGGWDGKDRR